MANYIIGETKFNTSSQSAQSKCLVAQKMRLGQDNSLNGNRGAKRERLEIMAEILLYCNQQKGKTNIMYRTNLNYAQLQCYLKSLTSQGLLMSQANKYTTTEKGQRFLELFNQLNEILSEDSER